MAHSSLPVVNRTHGSDDRSLRRQRPGRRRWRWVRRAWTARVLLALREFIGDAQRDAPREFAGAGVDRGQTSPRRFLAGPGFIAIDAAARILHDGFKARAGASAVDAVFVVRTDRTLGLLFNPTDGAHFVRVDEYVAELGIGSGASPVRRADGAGNATVVLGGAPGARYM